VKRSYTFQSKFARILRYISAGKLTVGLYFNSNLSYSTVAGGLLTIAYGMILIAIAVKLFIDTSNRNVV